MRSTMLVSVLVLYCATASAQDGPALGNWAPPPYWMPPAAESPEVPVARKREAIETRELPVREAQAAAGVEPLAITTPLPYVGIDPCRQYDSRATMPLPQNTPRNVLLTGAPCGIPATAQAVALNITIFNITGATGNGVFSIGITAPPPTAWINYPPTEAQRGNAGLAALTGAGEVVVQVNQGGAGFVDFVVDVAGYYAPVGIVNTLNTLSGDVTLAAGANVTITPAGQTLTIAVTGAAGATGPTGPTGPTGSQGLPGPTGWALTGNAGTNPATNFIGTTDNQALELRVDGLRTLRLEQVTATVGPNTYVGTNVLGGYTNNSITAGVTLATIAGGGGVFGSSPLFSHPNSVTDVGGTVGGGMGNQAGNNAGTLDDGQGATVGGGVFNTASASYSTVAGGNGNTASGADSAVAGGEINVASGRWSTVAGGFSNTASGFFSFVAGGTANVASGAYSVAAGGLANFAGGDYSFAVGNHAFIRDAATIGGGNTTGDQGTFVWADTQAADFVSTGPNQFLIRAAGGVGINTNDPTFSLDVMRAGDTQIGLRSDTTGGRVWTVQSSDGQAVGARAGSFQIVDRTAGVSRLLITSAGDVGIGTADPLGFKLAVAGEAAKPGGGSWTVFSDARLKRDIQPLERTLDQLLALRGVSFEYVDPAAIHELPGTRIGMVAQEVERVFPDWVSEGPDGYRRLTYRGFEALAVEALRDLREEKDAEIGALKSALETQRGESGDLKAALETQQAEIAALREAIERLLADLAERQRGNRR